MCVGKYELGKIFGEGIFVKVKIVRYVEIGESVVIKVLDKDKIFKYKMVE